MGAEHLEWVCAEDCSRRFDVFEGELTEVRLGREDKLQAAIADSDDRDPSIADAQGAYLRRAVHQTKVGRASR